MLFKVGDRVKFLNESGGGVVSAIISPSLVKVMIEDGFEIPTAAGELVLMDTGDPGGRFFREDVRVKLPDAPGEEETQPAMEMERVTPLLRVATKKPTPAGVYLAFVPHQQKWLITGALDIFLLNNTPCDLHYTYFLIENDRSFTGMDHDTIPAFSKMYLQTIDREEIGDWNQGILQILFFRDTMKKVLLPVSCNFYVKDSKFLKEDSYVSSSVLDRKALLTTLAEFEKMGTVTSRSVEGRSTPAPPDHTASRVFREPPLIEKHRTAPGEAEVDLHIEELVDNDSGLDPEHILRIQLDYFGKCLESALSNNYHKVIFIHGVGNGTLKSEVRMILDGYEGLTHQQASMAKYGVGAIEVNILHNR